MPPPVTTYKGPTLSGANESPSSLAGLALDDNWFEDGCLGRYEILGKLGAGGMGAVFKARHAELGKVVALKVLPAGQSDEVRVARFRNEVRAIGRLNHPNIVAAHDAGEIRGVHFLVMDFVEGMDLARLLDRRGRLSLSDACDAVHQSALGLQHAFERGLVHRDIKPSNLMLTRGGRVQVLDLGLARSFAEVGADTLTAQGMLLGTTDYLAPEQWEHAHTADTRADVYSLGCTLYHLLSGQPPFAGERFQSVLQKMRAHLETPPPPIGNFRPEMPTRLCAVLGRMLAKDPADRFQSPGEVAEALKPFTSGSDLASLLEEGAANAPAGLLSAEVPTPAPGLWETASERVDHGRPVPRASSRYVRPMTLAGCCLLLITGLLWMRFGGLSAPTAKPLAITEVSVTHFRDRSNLGDLRTSPQTVRVNDKMEFAADLTTLAYYYLIAFNPKGSETGLVQLWQPEGAAGQEAEAVRPERRWEVRPPYFIPDAVGLQVFVLAASTKPLPPFKDWQSQAGPLPWKGVEEGGVWRWHFDGRQFSRFPLERGRIEPREAVPKSLQKLVYFFTGRAEFEAVEVIAFPVADAKK
jgi:hypothetical protein